MKANLLPIGSVVQLRNGERRLMVTGRVIASSDDVVHDYCAVLYPDGLTGSDSLYFFDQDVVDVVYGVGFQDAEEAAFKAAVLSNVENPQVRDGQIVNLAVDLRD